NLSVFHPIIVQLKIQLTSVASIGGTTRVGLSYPESAISGSSSSVSSSSSSSSSKGSSSPPPQQDSQPDYPRGPPMDPPLGQSLPHTLRFLVNPSADCALSLVRSFDLQKNKISSTVEEKINEELKPSPIVASTSAEDQNNDTSTSEETASTNSSKPFIKFVKAGDKPAERPTTNKAEFVKAAERPTTDKVETTKKPAIRYAEMYRRTSKRPHGPPMRPQYRATWVPTVNRNFPPVNRKLPTGGIGLRMFKHQQAGFGNLSNLIVHQSYGKDMTMLIFPTSSDVFPLPEEVPTSRRKFPLPEEVPTGSEK
nr:hypothetical protein [Tanacetum cinerariifolium]